MHAVDVAEPLASLGGKLGERPRLPGLLGERGQHGQLALADWELAFAQEDPVLGEVKAQVPGRGGPMRWGRISASAASQRKDRVHRLQAGEQDHHRVRREERIDVVVIPCGIPDQDDGTRRIRQLVRVPIFAEILLPRPMHLCEMVAARNGRVESVQWRSPGRATVPPSLVGLASVDRESTKSRPRIAQVPPLNRPPP